MKIEEGKYYERRDGVLVGPASAIPGAKRWLVGGVSYEENGKVSFCTEPGFRHPKDLIREIPHGNPGTDDHPAPDAAETFAPLEDLLADRGSSHGNWKTQAELGQALKRTMRLHNADVMEKLRPDEREALEMIAVKISRILSGDPHFEDHWRDIAGYASLAADLNKTA